MYIRSLTFRCRPSSVRALLDSFSDQLTEEIIDLLRQLNIYQFTTMPPFQQEAPLTIQILSCWDVKKQVFVIGGKELSFTADEVALITRMPNRGEEVTWSSALTKTTSIQIKNRFEQQIITNTKSYVRLYIEFLLTNLFFPYHNYKVHVDLIKYGLKIEAFSKYNWAEAIWRVLLLQFDAIGRKFLYRKPLGYMSGFVTVLVIWFFEHCHVVSPTSRTATPRMMRWEKSVAWGSTRCSNLFIYLKPHQVSESFEGVSKDEMGLLATENDISVACPTPSPQHLSSSKSEKTFSSKFSHQLQLIVSGKSILKEPSPSHDSPSPSSPSPSSPPSATSRPTPSRPSPSGPSPSRPSPSSPPSASRPSPSRPTTTPTAPTTDVFNFLKNLETVLNDVKKENSKLHEGLVTRLNSFEEKLKELDRRVKSLEKEKTIKPTHLSSIIRGIKSRVGRKRKLLSSPYVSGQRKRRDHGKRKEIKESKENMPASDVKNDKEAAAALLTMLDKEAAAVIANRPD